MLVRQSHREATPLLSNPISTRPPASGVPQTWHALTECQLSQQQRVETGVGVMRCGWGDGREDQPRVWGSCQRVEEHSAMHRRGHTSMRACAGTTGLEGVAAPQDYMAANVWACSVACCPLR